MNIHQNRSGGISLDQNSPVNVDQRRKLDSQIRESYGRVVYTQKTHDMDAIILEKREKRLKTTQLIFSTIVAGAFLIVLFGNNQFATIIGTIISMFLLFLTTFMREFDFDGNARKHRNVAQTLWVIREDYISLIADMDGLEIEDIRKSRDELQLRTSEIYSNAPITSAKAYKMAQRALKVNEELTFSEDEIDHLLPNELRKKPKRGERDL